VDLVVRLRESRPPGLQDIEVVERKGLGHPDTMCDGIAEHICVRLCRYYLEHCGRILHHNVDKILLVGGAARPSFGGGEVVEPIEIYLAGRATEEYRGKRIPTHEIAVEACREWLRRHVRGLDIDRGVRIHPRMRPGAADLVRLVDDAIPLANDTSCGAGFAPLTDLERVVLEVERTLNSQETKRSNPEIGEDVKVMGIRRRTRIDLTIACAFVGRFVQSPDDYVSKKRGAREVALKAARRVTQCDVDATVNAADDAEHGSFFLTVTGTSAEGGDDGEVGRGNRTCGLITPYRPMTMEAAAGKNPVSHVGKLYNLAAGRMSATIAANVPHVSSAECVLVSQIGRLASEPRVVDVCLAGDDHVSAAVASKSVSEIVRSELERLADLRDALLEERVQVY
jgi:S-adenosylmethionine synthetase